MKEKVLIFLGGTVLGIAVTKYVDYFILGINRKIEGINREIEDNDFHSEFMTLEKKLKKDEENLVLKEGLKKGSAEYLKRLIELKENFIIEGEKIAKRINEKVMYGYCNTKIKETRRSVSQLKEELINM